MKPAEIEKSRKLLGLSQAELGELIGVSQGTVSNWERGFSTPAQGYSAELRRLFNEGAQSSLSRAQEATYGEWVRGARAALGFDRKELASQVGISEVQIYNIETGRTLNPRNTTRRALEKVLGAAPVRTIEAAEEAAQIPGVGQMTDFNPHDEGDFPSEPGVYVFYDISERPIYVGQSSNIKKRIRGQDGHVDKFWYKSPIVETAAYVKVEEEKLRRQLEETLIKFLKSNAVINKKGVDR